MNIATLDTNDTDLFTTTMEKINSVGKSNPYPALHYFYEFVQDNNARLKGSESVYENVLEKRLGFLNTLQEELNQYYEKNKLGVSEGIDALQNILSGLGKVNQDPHQFESQLKIYQMFHGCKNILQAKQDQWFKRTRHAVPSRFIAL